MPKRPSTPKKSTRAALQRHETAKISIFVETPQFKFLLAHFKYVLNASKNKLGVSREMFSQRRLTINTLFRSVGNYQLSKQKRKASRIVKVFYFPAPVN